jgi:hypothetical protein
MGSSLAAVKKGLVDAGLPAALCAFDSSLESFISHHRLSDIID